MAYLPTIISNTTTDFDVIPNVAYRFSDFWTADVISAESTVSGAADSFEEIIFYFYYPGEWMSVVSSGSPAPLPSGQYQIYLTPTTPANAETIINQILNSLTITFTADWLASHGGNRDDVLGFNVIHLEWNSHASQFGQLEFPTVEYSGVPANVHAPLILTAATQSIDEGNTFIVHFTSTDADQTIPDTAIFTLTDDNDKAVFDIVGNSLVFKALPD